MRASKLRYGVELLALLVAVVISILCALSWNHSIAKDFAIGRLHVFGGIGGGWFFLNTHSFQSLEAQYSLNTSSTIVSNWVFDSRSVSGMYIRRIVIDYNLFGASTLFEEYSIIDAPHNNGERMCAYQTRFPTLYIILALLLLPIARFARRLYRRKHNLCIECGYDLRGKTSASCSECGATTKTS